MHPDQREDADRPRDQEAAHHLHGPDDREEMLFVDARVGGDDGLDAQIGQHGDEDHEDHDGRDEAIGARIEQARQDDAGNQADEDLAAEADRHPADIAQDLAAQRSAAGQRVAALLDHGQDLALHRARRKVAQNPASLVHAPLDTRLSPRSSMSVCVCRCGNRPPGSAEPRGADRTGRLNPSYRAALFVEEMRRQDRFDRRFRLIVPRLFVVLPGG